MRKRVFVGWMIDDLKSIGWREYPQSHWLEFKPPIKLSIGEIYPNRAIDGASKVRITIEQLPEKGKGGRR